MREILTRELQEQAHRDMAKRLAQEEFDNLKLKSKVLQDQLDILGSPMTPPTTDEERALLASLKAPGPDIAAPGAGSTFSAPASGTPDTGSTNTVAMTPPAPDTSTNAPAVTIAMANPAAETGAPAPAPDSNTPARLRSRGRSQRRLLVRHHAAARRTRW